MTTTVDVKTIPATDAARLLKFSQALPRILIDTFQATMPPFRELSQ